MKRLLGELILGTMLVVGMSFSSFADETLLKIGESPVEISSGVLELSNSTAAQSGSLLKLASTSASTASKDALLDVADNVDDLDGIVKTDAVKETEAASGPKETGKGEGKSVTVPGDEEDLEAVEYSYDVIEAAQDTTQYSAKREELIAYAKQFLGNPYIYGGTSLTNGCDCSGFVQGIFKKFGITTGRTSRDQYANTKRISESELKPGDLVFYASGDYVNHVAIYCGKGIIIHAANSRSGIITSKYDYRTPYGFGRFIND